jgi:hypothetical protein
MELGIRYRRAVKNEADVAQSAHDLIQIKDRFFCCTQSST